MITIKNPICLIENKTKKIVVDNNNMTIDVWTKEVPAGLINFTINGTSYNAEDGMNWYEWCGSSYNTSDCTCAGLNHNILNSVGNLLYYNGNVYPKGQDLIIKDTAYNVSTSGGGSD